jgi:hypothetical protein
MSDRTPRDDDEQLSMLDQTLAHATDPPAALWPEPPTFVAPQGPRPITIQERFEAFHAANPWVYEALVKLALDFVARGHRRIGIGMLVEVVRWQYGRQTSDPTSGFKVNNNYRSRYARMIEARVPELAGMFETRELQSA